jgi:CRISPR-associated protein Cas1
LGLETARIPQADRHGLLWLGRGKLYVSDGTLRFASNGDQLAAGDYALPFQMITAILLEPGGTVTHDALRLLARHGTGLIAVGEDGARMYASMPFGPHDSRLARLQVIRWSDPEKRLAVARRMYNFRLGEVFPETDIAVLRGMEGSRMKETYRVLAQQYDIQWHGRRYDRHAPDRSDPPNQAINHAVTAVEACAMVAVAVTGTLPQLGFIHEDAAHAFCLDLADLYRDTVTLPCAFAAVRITTRDKDADLERVTRRLVGQQVREKSLVSGMIDRIKELIDADDRSGNT